MRGSLQITSKKRRWRVSSKTLPLRWQRQIGGRIKCARLQAGISQVRLARRIGATERTLRRWERGRGDLVRLGQLVLIAEATGQSLNYFMEQLDV